MIAVGTRKKIKNKDISNYCHHMPMIPLLGANHCLPSFHMAERLIWINETKKRINEFTIGYMINTGLNVNKSFREQVGKCMYTTFGKITQHFIKATSEKDNTSVLSLIMFYETRADNPKKVSEY